MKFLRKYLSLFFIIISIFSFSYIFFKILNQGNEETNYNYIYFIFPLIFIILSTLAHYIKNDAKDNLILIFLSFIFSFYFAETYLILKNNNFFKSEILDNAENEDTRSTFEVHSDLLLKNKDAKVVVAPTGYLNKNNVLIPLSGVSKAETLYCKENGYYSIYDSDRYGFNNPDYEWDKKNIEYFLIGDSLTQGACVNRPDEISSILRILSNKAVLNLGYGGNGPLLKLASLREYLKVKVNKIVWIHTEATDIFDLNFELQDKILKKYLNDTTFSQNLINKQKEIDKLASFQITEARIKKEAFDIKKNEFNLVKYFKNISSFIKLTNTRTLIISKFIKDKQSTKNNKLNDLDFKKEEFKKILINAKNISQNNDADLYFVFFPSVEHFLKDHDKSKYLQIKRIIEDLDIPFIDLYKEINKNVDDPVLIYPYNKNSGHYGHLTVEGYKIVAEIIFKYTSN